MRHSLLLLSLLTFACGESPGDDSVSVPDPRVDDVLPDAPFTPGQRRDVGDATAIFTPPAPNEFVSGVVMPGDLDADGYGDLVLWTYRHSDPDVVPCEDGCPAFTRIVVYIDYGGPEVGDGGAIVPDAVLEGWHINDLRTWVSPAGDIDADGRADVLISVGGRCEQGNVFTLFGGERLSGTHDLRDVAPMIRQEGSCTGFGTAVGVGDLDADGHDDFVIAEPLEGRSYLFYGGERPGERRSELDADAVLLGTPDHAMGPAQTAGDVDGDGHDDLLLSEAPTWRLIATSVRWWLLGGGPRLSGEVAMLPDFTTLDAAMVQGLGDLDGDGRAELGVAAHPETPSGYVVVGRMAWPNHVSPEDGTLHVTRERAGDPTFTRPGALVRAGDVNGDGLADFLFTDADASEDGFTRGAAYLFLGPASLDAPTLDLGASVAFLGRTWQSEEDGRLYGYDELSSWSWHLGNGLAGGSDLDADGHDDIALVGRLADHQGLVYVWRGRS